MPDIRSAPACASSHTNRFKEAVCVETARIFDSCSDKDCLEDLQMLFTAESQAVVDAATLIRLRAAEVLDVALSATPVPFNRGYYAVDLIFYIRTHLSCFFSSSSTPVNVLGLVCHSKKVVLFGSEGNVKSFSSNTSPEEDLNLQCGLPVARIRTAEPVMLSSRIADSTGVMSTCPGIIPANVAAAFDGEIITQPVSDRAVFATLGLFSIVTLERPVQLMIPVYDYVLPEREAVSSIASDDPGEMFSRIKFPVNEFFPENLNDASCGTCGN